MNLFHYTDLNGLKGIIENNSLWATNLYFLNDRNEAVHGFLCFENTIQYLDEKIISAGKKKILQDALDICKSNGGHGGGTKGTHIYSISFCMDSDKLSQWRGYGAHQGVCIEFDKEKLIDGLDVSDMTFFHNEVNYTNESSTVKMNESINNFFSELNLRPETIDDDFSWFVSSYGLINKVTPFFKNDGFSEENEYRFVFLPGCKIPNVLFRVNNNGLVPYINVEMKKRVKLPIKRVIIGPAKDFQFVFNGVEMLLDKHGYKEVLIENSKVSYRG